MYPLDDQFNFLNPKPPKWPNINEEQQAAALPPPAAPPPLDPPPEPAYQRPDVTNQQMFLEDKYRIKTRGPEAEEAEMNARAYRPESYRQGTQLMPQQYGQEGGQLDEERPLSPQATAEAMPATADAMDKLIKQHMLGIPKAPTASKEGYQNSLTAKREAEALAKAQRREQGALNRAERREKDADVATKMFETNRMQGAGGGQEFGPTQERGNVFNMGGYTFVGGKYRPEDSMERSKRLNLESEPEREAAKLRVQTRGQDLTATAAKSRLAQQMEQQAALDQDRDAGRKQTEELAKGKAKATADEAGRKLALQARARFDELVRQAREMEGSAYNRLGKNLDSGKRLEDFLDEAPDPHDKTGTKFIKKPGQYQSTTEELLRMGDVLAHAYEQGYDQGDQPPEVLQLLQRLRYKAGKEKSPIAPNYQ